MKVIEMGCLQLADGMVGILIEATKDELKRIGSNLLYKDVTVVPELDPPPPEKKPAVRRNISPTCFEQTKEDQHGHQVEADVQRRLPEGVSQDGGGEAPRDIGVEEAAQAPE